MDLSPLPGKPYLPGRNKRTASPLRAAGNSSLPPNPLPGHSLLFPAPGGKTASEFPDPHIGWAEDSEKTSSDGRKKIPDSPSLAVKNSASATPRLSSVPARPP